MPSFARVLIACTGASVPAKGTGDARSAPEHVGVPGAAVDGGVELPRPALPGAGDVPFEEAG